MGALVVVDKIKDRNWSKYIHEWIMAYIKKYLTEGINSKHINRTLGGCIYHLAVCYHILLVKLLSVCYYCIFIFLFSKFCYYLCVLAGSLP
jgi:hypothetical protein